MLSPDSSPDPGFDDKKIKKSTLETRLWIRIFVFWFPVGEDKKLPTKIEI
jgi:hypothetical protein